MKWEWGWFIIILLFKKHGYSKPKCHYLHDVQLFFVIILCVQRTTQTSFRIFLQTKIMVDGAKFNSHDSGSHFNKSNFKNGCWKKNSWIFVSELKLQVRLSMQSLHRGKSRNRWTFSKIENLRFLKNYDDYNCIFGIKLKGPSLSFIWRVMQWN